MLLFIHIYIYFLLCSYGGFQEMDFTANVSHDKRLKNVTMSFENYFYFIFFRPCILIMDSLKLSVHERIFKLLRE